MAEALVPEPTLDQEELRRTVESGASFRVIAHAGTGKTTTLLWSLARCVCSRALLLEYNRDLRLEARRLAQQAGLTHIEVHNYDSFLLEYYDKQAPSKDFQLALQRVLKTDGRPLRGFSYAVIVVDEAQDMTVAFAAFLKKVLRDNLEDRVQLVLAGDPKQTIYGFRGARSEFLSEQDEWQWGPKLPLVVPLQMSLAETFRFGDTMCAFVNLLCGPLFKRSDWGRDIISAFTGGDVVEWTAHRARRAPSPTTLIAEYSSAVARGTVCVLAQSVREENAALTHFLEHLGLEEERLATDDHAPSLLLVPSEDELAGRPVLRTIHTSKGRQYDTVFFFLTQREMWLTDTGRLKKDRNTLLYVACTRARRALHIVQDDKERVFDAVRAKAGAPVPAAQRSASAADDAKVYDDDTKIVPAFGRSGGALLEKLSSVDEKEDFLWGLLSPILCRIPNGGASPQFEEPTVLEDLVLRCRAEWHATSEGAGFLAPLLRWASEGHGSPGAQVVYARLGRRSMGHIFLESFKAKMESLDPRSCSWEHWALIASFHPERRYGHAPAMEAPPREHLCSCLYAAFISVCGTLHYCAPDTMYGHDFTTTCGWDHHLFYADLTKRELVCPVFCAAEALRPQEALAAALAASRMGFETATVVYLQRGAAYRLSVAQGAASWMGRMLARADQWSAR